MLEGIKCPFRRKIYGKQQWQDLDYAINFSIIRQKKIGLFMLNKGIIVFNF